MNLSIGKTTIYGTEKKIEIAKETLEQYLPVELFNENESKARFEIQKLIDEHNIKATVLWDGNRVWSKEKILKDVKALIKRGMHALSDYLYEFFHLCCGSIAHYNKQGWICEYPDIPAIRNFFIRNEYGKSILEWQPWWATDRIEIIKKIYNLFNIKQELT